jgi:hypothetical protein
MSPPRFGAPSRADRNTRSTSWAIDAREKEIPIVVDVDEIHTLEYEANPVTIEEEHNPVQEAEQLEEDTERNQIQHIEGTRATIG